MDLMDLAFVDLPLKGGEMVAVQIGEIASMRSFAQFGRPWTDVVLKGSGVTYHCDVARSEVIQKINKSLAEAS